MSKLREPPISNCEKKFVVKCLAENTRLDGRSFQECRDITLEFGSEWGCCVVSLGKTRVIAQVSCEIQTPNTSRLSEGILNINVELNPLAAPHFEAGQRTDLSIQLNRTLEKCLKDSKAVDLESLCIKAKEKVWALRLDVNVLNHEGNILDCASMAALSSLAHFRRPDVTFDGEDIIIHSEDQKDPIPLELHHYPVCISYAIFSNGEVILSDPTILEEAVSDAHIIVGMNSYRELCSLHIGGSALLAPDTILRTTATAAKRAVIVIDLIKESLGKDKERRLNNEEVGFQHSLFFSSQSADCSADLLSTYLDGWSITNSKSRKRKHAVKDKNNEDLKTDTTGDNMEENGRVAEDMSSLGVVKSLGKQSAVLIPTEKDAANGWNPNSSGDEEDEDVEIVDVKPAEQISIDVSDGSEEEEVVVLNADEKTNKKNKNKKKSSNKS